MLLALVFGLVSAAHASLWTAVACGVWVAVATTLIERGR
jgi:hypothetical protein